MNDEKPEATPTAESSPGSPLTEKNERKLDLEIDNLKIKNKWEARGPLMPIAATLLAIAGFLFTVIQFQCGRASEQQKDRANRQAEQQRDRNLRTAEQLARCQDQLRLDSSELIKSAQEQRQTSSGVSFLLEDVRAALACKVNETQKLSDLFPDYEHALTEGLVNLVRDDYDFVKNPRDVSLANAIIEHWTDYTTYLKKEPGDLDYILYKYTDALQDLRNQNPGYMECLAVDKETQQVTVCREFEKHKNQEQLYNYFADLVAGFEKHAELLGGEPLQEDARKRRDKIYLDFQEAICNRVISEHFLRKYLPGGRCR
ncbi:MAG: hypothetical protein QOH41_565 [Blastocatellia bacterium]|jgi:hypothetical protein|nr:hypothetical protein [Blastocatellia bacterium]